MCRALATLISLLFLLGVSSAPPVQFTAAGIDDVLDLHGDPASADLVIFAGGNQWFVMPQLIAAFKARNPWVKNVYYETLPPGILAQQIQAGSLAIDDLVVRVRADVYLGGVQRTTRLYREGFVGAPQRYASNALGIMVRAGNPKHISSLVDLGRDDVRVAMPNPRTEGIARQIEIAYRHTGGQALDTRIMQQKRADGTTRVTAIHHRETPKWILEGKADAGPVWLTEALYQERIHSGIEAIAVPASQNVRANDVAAIVRSAPHPAAAAAFLAFLVSPRAAAIYASYGFDLPARTKE